MMLHVEIKAGTDVTTAEMCPLYWSQPERPTRKRPFLYSVEEMGTRFGFSRIAVGRTVEQWCYAYDPVVIRRLEPAKRGRREATAKSPAVGDAVDEGVTPEARSSAVARIIVSIQ